MGSKIFLEIISNSICNMQNGNACKMAMYFCILIDILPYVCAKFSAK